MIVGKLEKTGTVAAAGGKFGEVRDVSSRSFRLNMFPALGLAREIPGA